VFALLAVNSATLPAADGADRIMAERLEGIELCAALTEAKRDETGRYFSRNGNY
jgi:hypothetical protein